MPIAAPVAPPPLTWVIGAGGLLGSALVRQLRISGRPCHHSPVPLPWQRPAELPGEMGQAVDRFREALGTGQPWRIVWAAGTGVMGSREEDLEAERIGFLALSEAIAAQQDLGRRRGCLGLASSAGALYADSPLPIDEQAPLAPRNPYGLWKLAQEGLVRELVAGGHVSRGFLARISSLYGAGQATGKTQGLISHLARQLLRRRPVRIYVPLDTMRDYIAVDDAARMLLAGCESLGADQSGEGQDCLARIIASERSVTISELVGLFRRLLRRAPQVITTLSGPVPSYGRCVRYRSGVLPQLRALASTPLPLGVTALLAQERLRLARGGEP
ncbi:MAG: NAD-dependent epimerase/dehydratase family protein [Synechococcaceae cyanobacterium]|nr:NAD-dependent epimerase/dehydratase family protein [Synechococcaceae cyanobacterium]